MLLAIDTSAGTSVAIVDRDAGVLAARNSADTRRHAEVVGTFISEVLDDAKISVTDLSGVAVGMGPGPFTGLRVGIAAARVFAFGAGKPIVPIVSHDAIAFHSLTQTVRPLLVVTDARRREVYWSTYSGLDAGGIPIRVEGPGLCRPENLAEAVTDCGSFERLDAATVAAASLGLLAEALFAGGRNFAADEALYLRSPDVTVSTGPKRVS
ncbi:MAG: tRNA (adenosine(37)-N6)-threonylcarbamoyltransferase complex dimerization subunit type 1 TsaB [Microbacteriaceae bacterium]